MFVNNSVMKIPEAILYENLEQLYLYIYAKSKKWWKKVFHLTPVINGRYICTSQRLPKSKYTISTRIYEVTAFHFHPIYVFLITFVLKSFLIAKYRGYFQEIISSRVIESVDYKLTLWNFMALNFILNPRESCCCIIFHSLKVW